MMRYLAIMLLLSGCATTQGMWDASLGVFLPTNIAIRYTHDLSACGIEGRLGGCVRKSDDGKFRDCFVIINSALSRAQQACFIQHEVRDCLGKQHDPRPTNECGFAP